MTPARLVGLDVGTSSTKGVLIDEAGAVLAEATRAYGLSSPRPGWAEQDPETWWAAASAVLDELRASEADGIGLTGQMHGLVALGADARPLRPAILWNDGRSQPQCDAIEARLGVERLVALSGNRALAGFTAPKMMWLAEHEPDVFARVRHVLLPKDYVRMRLCDGAPRVTDVADGSGTLLMDVGARAWSAELCAAFGVDPTWLPELQESVEVSGTAFDGRVPVAAGAGDQAAGALGAGVVDATGPASVVLGTSGVVFAARDGFAPDAQGRLHAFCHAAPDAWHVMGVELSAAGALAWLREATAGASVGFSALVAEAERWPAGVEGLRFAPYLSGERTPHADADVRAAFVGLGLRHDRGALVRAVLEGVAHGLADGWDLVRAGGGGAAPAVGRLSGGGAQSDLWASIVAATLDLPLERTASPAGAAYGAALLGGVAGGVFVDVREAVAACVRPTERVQPDPELVAAYAAERERFRALYPALRALG